eukprot:sb/3478060/
MRRVCTKCKLCFQFLKLPLTVSLSENRPGSCFVYIEVLDIVLSCSVLRPQSCICAVFHSESINNPTVFIVPTTLSFRILPGNIETNSYTISPTTHIVSYSVKK